MIHVILAAGGKLQRKCNIPKFQRGRGGVECKFLTKANPDNLEINIYKPSIT